MRVFIKGSYPENWQAIAFAVKEAAGWRCVRCGHRAERAADRLACDRGCDVSRHAGRLNDGRRRVLTVHHLDGDKSNCEWFNLAALCQRCHLIIQGRVVMERPYLLEHSEWFKPYVAGFYAFRFLGVQLTRAETEARLEELLSLQVHMKG